jgi:hypothetical protein
MTRSTSSGAAKTAANRKSTEQILTKMLAIIRSHPGIRPSELNRRLRREQSDSLRATLIRRGLVRKVKDGATTHLYAKPGH